MNSKSKIPKTFFVFLIASGFIWLLITFSKEYKSTISYSLAYKNIPQDKLLQEPPTNMLKVLVKGSGFKILTARLASKKLELNATQLKKGKKAFYFLMKEQLKNIESQIHSGLEVVNIERDTLFLNLGALQSKRIKITPVLDINYHIGYGLIGAIQMRPDSVLVSGPEQQLQNLTEFYTEKLILKDVKENFKKELKIKVPTDKTGLKFESNIIMVSGKVDKFTEGTLEVPFIIKNVPEALKVTTLKETLEIKFVVALTNFNKVTASSLKVECDFAYAAENNLGYLIPKLISKPDFIKSYKIIPNKIDFLIRK